MAGDTGPRYAAFISYSRTNDTDIAKALQGGLQRFARPWNRPRALRIFRDDTGLSASPTLWAGLEAAMADSGHLILLASPESAGSAWVDREVGHWLATRSVDTILVVVTSGEIAWGDGSFDRARTTCLPPALLAAVTEEPRWVDLRDVPRTVDLTLKEPRIHAAVAELGATLHHRDKDDLIGEDIQRFKQSRRLARAAVAGLAALALLATTGGVAALRQSALAEERRRDAVAAGDVAMHRQLLAQADVAAPTDPVLAAQLAVAALTIADDAPTRAMLAGTVVGTRMRSVTLGGGGIVRGVAYSHSGSVLVVGADGHHLSLWRLSDQGAPVRLAGPLPDLPSIHSVVFSPDDRFLAVGTGEGMMLFDVADPAAPKRLSVPLGGWGPTISFAPDGRSLAVFADDALVVYDLSDPARPYQSSRFAFPAESVDGFAIATDWSMAAVGRVESDDDTDYVDLWDLTDLAQPALVSSVDVSRDDLDTIFNGVETIALSPNSAYLAVAFEDAGEGVFVWDLTDRARPKLIDEVLGHSAGVTQVAFTGDSATLAIGSEDYQLALWGLRGPRAPVRRSLEFAGQRAATFALAFAPDGRTIASGNGDGTMVVWDTVEPRWVQRFGSTFGRYTLDAAAVSFVDGPGGRRVMAQPTAGGVQLTDVTDPLHPGTGVALLTGANDTAAVTSADGTVIASPQADNQVQLWDASGTEPRSRGVLTLASGAELDNLAIAPDGRLLVTHDTEDGLEFWDITDRSAPRQVDEILGFGWAWDLEFSPDGQTLAVDDGGDEVTIIDVGRPGSMRVVAEAPVDGTLTRMAISPDNRTLAAGTRAGVFLWDITDRANPRQRPVRLANGTGHATALAFTPDNHTLVAGGSDATLALWDITDQDHPTLIGRTSATGDPVTGLGFASDTLLATSDSTGTAQFWTLEPLHDLHADLVARACALALGGLSEAAWHDLLPGRPFVPTCH